MMEFSAKMRPILEDILIIGKALHEKLKDFIANGRFFGDIENKPFDSCILEPFQLELIPFICYALLT
jgi:hypothetical protein